MKKLESNVSNSNEVISQEDEARKIEKILDQAPFPFKQLPLIKRVFNGSNPNEGGPISGAAMVYALGRIHGIQEERKRRAGGTFSGCKSIHCTNICPKY